MVLKSQLDELIETLTDYTTYLRQFGYDEETVFCAYAVVEKIIPVVRMSRKMTFIIFNNFCII